MNRPQHLTTPPNAEECPGEANKPAPHAGMHPTLQQRRSAYSRFWIAAECTDIGTHASGAENEE